jgi:hypothetical protein
VPLLLVVLALVMVLVHGRIMKPGDSVLLVSCGYDTEGATELFQPYKELAARLNVRCAELGVACFLWALQLH